MNARGSDGWDCTCLTMLVEQLVAVFTQFVKLGYFKFGFLFFMP